MSLTPLQVKIALQASADFMPSVRDCSRLVLGD